MKNRIKRLLVGLVCVFAFVVCAAPAALATEYTYTVTLSMGNHGSYTGSGIAVESTRGGSAISSADGIVTITGLHYGDRVTFSGPDAATVDSDSKYYVKGVRLSGRDNNTVGEPSFAVDGDADYVIAYGIKGDMVQYTVEYVDDEGKTLAESRTYYGNVGDEAVVAYLYMEGYRPMNFNLSRVLSSNAAENVFTFVYTRYEPDVVEIVDGGTTYIDGGTSTRDDGTTTEDQGTEEETEEVEEIVEEVIVEVPVEDDTAADSTGGDSGETETEEETIDEETINENQTPLARLAQQIAKAIEQVTGGSTAGNVVFGVGVAALLALIAFLVVLLVRRLKDKDEDETGSSRKHE